MDNNHNFKNATLETIVIPIRVIYQSGTSNVYAYDMPTRDDITSALENTNTGINQAKQGVSEAARLLRTMVQEDRRLGVVLDYLEAAGQALGISSGPPMSGMRSLVTMKAVKIA